MAPKKIALITGANTGIGRETALALAKQGIKVFITCRSWEKGREAVVYIQDACPSADVEILLLDLRSLDSVRKCASEFKSRKLPLNCLVNNAGATLGKPWYTEEGIGGSAQVNFLGHYTLTRLLQEELMLGAPSRVINVTSITHRHVSIPDPEKFLRDFKAGGYPECKLGNVLFTLESQHRWQGLGIESSAVDPGAVWSDIWRRSVYGKPPVSWLLKAVYSPTWDGAQAVIHAAVAPYDPPKKGYGPFRYFARGFFATPMMTYPTMPLQKYVHLLCSFLDWPIRRLTRGLLLSEVKDVPAAPAAYDKDTAAALWNQAALAAGFDDS